MTFANQLAAERQRLGLTLREFAALLDVSPRTLDHWIAGTRVPLAVAQEGVMARLADESDPS